MFGFWMGAVSVALGLVDLVMPDGLVPLHDAPSWSRLVIGAIAALAVGVLTCAALAVTAAAVVRWLRRLVVRLRYRDQAV
jgi:hypothetical protein